MAGEIRQCVSCKSDFDVDREDFEFYERIKVPQPSFCPHCRMIRRFLFRNEHLLFKRKDSASGRDIYSSFPPEAKVKVFGHDYWWSDKWDPMEYGLDYDFSRPFFEQFRELFYSVPLPSRSVRNLVNADYCDQAAGVKNSYLCFDADEIENSGYIVNAGNIKSSFDVSDSMRCELCYEDIMVSECYRVFYSLDCENCVDVWFSKDLSGCQNCIGCVNLRSKSYYIFNKPYSKDEYHKRAAEFNFGSYARVQEMLREIRRFMAQFPVKYLSGSQNVNVSGEHIQNSKNVRLGYSINDCENIGYSQIVFDNATECYDLTNFGQNSSYLYECVTCGGNSSKLRFCWECWQGDSELEYSAYCNSSSNLLGCVGLRKKEYCIFNKQYSKNDYFSLREKIIRHMHELPYIDANGKTYKYGEFFPPEISPFAYNETYAHDFFPLGTEEAAKRGYLWREQNRQSHNITKDWSELPDNVKDADEAITKDVIRCKKCGGAYRVIRQELQFLQSICAPLPRLCTNCRYKERANLANPPKYCRRKCACSGESSENGAYKNFMKHFHGNEHCPNEFETSYAQNRPEIVYCESCYNSELV